MTFLKTYKTMTSKEAEMFWEGFVIGFDICIILVIIIITYL